LDPVFPKLSAYDGVEARVARVDLVDEHDALPLDVSCAEGLVDDLEGARAESPDQNGP